MPLLSLQGAASARQQADLAAEAERNSGTRRAMEADLAEMYARLEEQKAKSGAMREQVAGLQAQVRGRGGGGGRRV